MGDLAEALRRRLEDQGVSYRKLAELLVDEGVTTTKDTVALWVNGRQPLWPDEVFAVERALGCAPGALSAEAGYVPAESRPARTFQEVVMSDTRLDDRAKDMLLAAFDAAIRRARSREGHRA